MVVGLPGSDFGSKRIVRPLDVHRVIPIYRNLCLKLVEVRPGYLYFWRLLGFNSRNRNTWNGTSSHVFSCFWLRRGRRRYFCKRLGFLGELHFALSVKPTIFCYTSVLGCNEHGEEGECEVRRVSLPQEYVLCLPSQLPLFASWQFLLRLFLRKVLRAILIIQWVSSW